jgi:general stress protein YciG
MKTQSKYARRGFASMDKEKQRLIARRGGLSAQEQGKAHQFTSEEASRAGKLGGIKAGGKNRKRVVKLSSSGKVLELYESVTKASFINHIHIQQIIGVCKGRARLAGGFQWQYAN